MLLSRIFLVLFLVASCGLFGCFGDAENPLTAEETDGRITEEEVLSSVPHRTDSGSPAVRLVSDGYSHSMEGRNLSCLYHLEIDAPLEHHLFVYVEGVKYSKKSALFEDEIVSVKKRLMLVIEKGDTVSGLYAQSGGYIYTNETRSVVRILPLSEINPVHAPTTVILGEIAGDPARSRVTTQGIDRDYDYKPYRMGNPSDLEYVFIEEWERITAEKKAEGAEDAEQWAEDVAKKKAN